jgi:hypothetical protein
MNTSTGNFCPPYRTVYTLTVILEACQLMMMIKYMEISPNFSIGLKLQADLEAGKSVGTFSLVMAVFLWLMSLALVRSYLVFILTP